MSRRHKSTKRNKKAKQGAKPPHHASRTKQLQTIQQSLRAAVQHHSAGDLRQAEGIYQKILQLDPHQPDALHLLGVIAHQVGSNDVAVEMITKAVAVRPNFAEAHSNLGIALKELGRLDDAVTSYDRAIAINPDYAEVHSNLGVALQALGRLPEAVASYRKAVAIKPDYAEPHSNLGTALDELGEVECATASYQKALTINPNYADGHSNLGQLYERLNRLDEADAHIRKALEINPKHHSATICLSALLRRRGQTKEAIEILEQLPPETLQGTNAPKAHFELGKLYDLELDCERAFECFALGNLAQSHCHGNRASAERYLQAIENTARLLTPEWIAAWHVSTNAPVVDSPVFLIGFPRSGTTLLDQMLDGHPRLQTMEERPVIDSIALAIDARPGGYPSALASLNEREIEGLRREYHRLAAVRMSRAPATILVDKFPLNIRHIPLIERLFPGARILLALRHPADVVLSNFMQMYKLNDAMANFQSLESTARLYTQVMSLWRQCVDLLPLNVHTVKYEDVVADLEGESRRLLQFLDVDWHDAVMDYRGHAQQRERINTPSYEQVTEPIYERAKYRWKRYQMQLAPVLPQLDPFIEAFGYA